MAETDSRKRIVIVGAGAAGMVSEDFQHGAT